MEENDPWSSNVIEPTKTQHKCEFEDNFVDNSQKLPDSAEYLAALERKLSKLKKTTGCVGKDQQDLLNSLEDSRKSCMLRLIAGDASIGTNDDIALDTPVNLNSTAGRVKSHINPEQPLTVGELVELVKADYLGIENSDPEIEEKPT